MRRAPFLAFLVIMFLCMFGSKNAEAEAPVQVSLVSPVQLVSEEESVKGFRLNLIYGFNENMTGVDLGIVNRIDFLMSGVQLGIINYAADMTGIQFGLVNRTDWLTGVQIGLLNFNGNNKAYGFLPIINWSF